MRPEIDRNRAKLYFNQDLLKLASTVLTVTALGSLPGGHYIIAVAAALIGAGVLFAIYKYSLSDAEVDSYYAACGGWLVATAPEKLNIRADSLTRESDLLLGIDREFSGELFRSRKGKNGVFRVNKRRFMVIMYGVDQIMLYAASHAIESGRTGNENTEEYFYNDVVSVRTTETHFSLDNTGGNSITIPLSKERGDFDRAAQAVNNVRAMLREKKAAAGTVNLASSD